MGHGVNLEGLCPVIVMRGPEGSLEFGKGCCEHIASLRGITTDACVGDEHVEMCFFGADGVCELLNCFFGREIARKPEGYSFSCDSRHTYRK